MVLAPGEVILFLWKMIAQRGLPLVNARNVGFHLGGPVNWAGRKAQVDMMLSTCRKAIEPLQTPLWEREPRPGGPGCP